MAILPVLTPNHNECILPKMAENIVGMHLWSFLYPSQTGPTTSLQPVGDQILHVIAVKL